MSQLHIEELIKKHNFILTMHGFNHANFEVLIKKTGLKYSKKIIELFKTDLDNCIKDFQILFKFIPTSYCFPYNYDFNRYFYWNYKKRISIY